MLTDKRPLVKSRLLSYVIMLSIGSLLGAAAIHLYYRNKTPSVNGFDHSGDGILDEKFVTSDGVLDSVVVDRNFDGHDDFIMLFLATGHIQSSKSDDDFDGVFETESSFTNNQPSAVRVDTDADGKFDLIQYFVSGVPTESYIRNPKTGLKERKYIYHLGKLVKSYKDLDSDGVYEIECSYNFFEEENCATENRSDL